MGGITPIIRRAAASEAAVLSDLVMRSKAHWGYDEDFLDACREELRVTPEDIETTEFWVAETDHIVGLYKLRPSERGYVHLVFIEPDMIGTGLGKILWNHLEGRARATGCEMIYLEADPFARPFYEHMGMKAVGETPSGTLPGRMLPVMEKQLD